MLVAALVPGKDDKHYLDAISSICLVILRQTQRFVLSSGDCQRDGPSDYSATESEGVNHLLGAAAVDDKYLARNGSTH